jgi:hypothetical protein
LCHLNFARHQGIFLIDVGKATTAQTPAWHEQFQLGKSVLATIDQSVHAQAESITFFCGCKGELSPTFMAFKPLFTVVDATIFDRFA